MLYLKWFPKAFTNSQDLSEHERFQGGIEEMKIHLINCLPLGTRWGVSSVVTCGPLRTQLEPSPFDGIHLRSIVDSFVEPLTIHVSSPLMCPRESTEPAIPITHSFKLK